MVSKKVENNIDIGLWASYGHPADDYSAAAFEGHDPETGNTHFTLSFHKGAMPAFNSESFDTLDELEARMRELEPDLRKWKTRQ